MILWVYQIIYFLYNVILTDIESDTHYDIMSLDEFDKKSIKNDQELSAHYNFLENDMFWSCYW